MMSGDIVIQVLAGAAVKGTVVLALAAALSLALRRRPASLRHLVWSLALGAVLLTPVLAPLVPSWSVPGLPRVAARQPVEAVEGGAVASAGTPELEGGRSMAPLPAARADGRRTSLARVGAGSTETAPPRVERVADRAPGRAGVPWDAVLVLVWLAGALIVGAGIALGVARTWYLAGHARPVKSGRLRDVAARLAARLGIARHVAVLQYRGSCMPMTWGLERPCVLLPAEADDWPDDLLRTVLLHELAHVKRFDYLTQLVARLACAVHWFNPLVWLAARRLRVERELACDDEVLRAGSRASDYAGHLLEMALSLRARPFLASVAMARRSQLSARLRAVLDAGRARNALTSRFVISATLCAALVALTVAAASPSRSANDSSAARERPGRARVATGRSLVPLAEIVDRPAPPARSGGVAQERATSLAGNGATSVSQSSPLRPGSAGRAPYDPARVQRAALCDWNVRDASSSMMIQRDDDAIEVKAEVDDCELEVDLSGEITFSADETEIVGLSPGGELEIEEKRGRASRRLKVEADRSGDLERRWWVDRDERPYDADARAWLSDMIVVLFRRAGIQAEERAERILARDGVDGLLEEISYIPGDYVAGRYYGVLLSRADLDPETVRRVVRRAAEDIESDHTLGRLLIAVAENQPVDETVQIAYLEAAGSIGSDFEQRRVLAAALNSGMANRRVLDMALETAADIGSDHELTRFLAAILSDNHLDDRTRPGFFAAAATIDSDYELSRLLTAVVKSDWAGESDVEAVLESALEISSDHELSKLLIEIARSGRLTERLRPAFMRATDTIESDHERGRVLSAAYPRSGARI